MNWLRKEKRYPKLIMIMRKNKKGKAAALGRVNLFSKYFLFILVYFDKKRNLKNELYCAITDRPEIVQMSSSRLLERLVTVS